MATVSEKIRTVVSNTSAAETPGDQLRTLLRNNNAIVLGAGLFGAAFEENGEVFKLFSKNERGYNAYVQYLKGKSGVIQPRIKVIGSFGDFTCVHIERLYTMSTEIGYNVAERFAFWAHQVANRALYRASGFHVARCKIDFPDEAHQYVNKANMAGLLTKIAKFAKTYIEENGHINWDLHSGNFMVRRNADGTKQIVLTDPFCQ